jgi:uncharacterized protein (UPF0212 family)
MEIDADARECPVCGYEFPHSNPAYVWIAMLLVILILLFLIF